MRINKNLPTYYCYEIVVYVALLNKNKKMEVPQSKLLHYFIYI